MKSYDSKLLKTSFTKVFQQKLTVNSYQFCDELCWSTAGVRSHMIGYGWISTENTASSLVTNTIGLMMYLSWRVTWSPMVTLRENMAFFNKGVAVSLSLSLSLSLYIYIYIYIYIYMIKICGKMDKSLKMFSSSDISFFFIPRSSSDKAFF